MSSSKRIVITPFTSKKFFDACFLILKNKTSPTSIQVKKILGDMLSDMEHFQKNHSKKPTSSKEWQELEINMMKSVDTINQLDKACAERLKMIMQTGFERLKKQGCA